MWRRRSRRRSVTTILSAPSRSAPKRPIIRRARAERGATKGNRLRTRKRKARAARRRRKRNQWIPTTKLHSPIITPAEMRAAEGAAFARGISAEKLMEQAGERIAYALIRFFPRAGRCVVFAGKGHNAGDALVAARWLAQAGWEIETRLVYPEKELSGLTNRKLEDLRAVG